VRLQWLDKLSQRLAASCNSRRRLLQEQKACKPARQSTRTGLGPPLGDEGRIRDSPLSAKNAKGMPKTLSAMARRRMLNWSGGFSLSGRTTIGKLRGVALVMIPAGGTPSPIAGTLDQSFPDSGWGASPCKLVAKFRG
jgi:hypothetical protein